MDTQSLIIGIVIGAILTFLLLRYSPSIFSGTSLCKPSYVYGSPWIGDELCKTACYGVAKVTSFKHDKADIGGQTIDACYCDVNNCNPS